MKCFFCDKEATQKSTDIKSTVYHCIDCGFELTIRFLKKFPGTLICTTQLNDKDKNKMIVNKNLVNGIIRFVKYLHNNNIEYSYDDVFCEKTGVFIFKLKRLCGNWKELKFTSEFIEDISNLDTFDDYIEHYVEKTLK